MTTIDVTELDLRDRADDQFVDAHVRRTVEHKLHGATDILRAEHDRARFGIRDDWTQPEEVAVHIARAEVAGPDAVTRLLCVERLAEREECGLARAVGDAGVRREPPGRVGGHHDYLASARSPQAGQHDINGSNNRREVGVDDGLNPVSYTHLTLPTILRV